jgi:hypothetical protein
MLGGEDLAESTAVKLMVDPISAQCVLNLRAPNKQRLLAPPEPPRDSRTVAPTAVTGGTNGQPPQYNA